MRTPSVALIVLLVLSAAVATHAQQILDDGETLDILDKLTGRNQSTWIPAGVMEATRQTYIAPVTTDEDEIERQIQQEIKAFQAYPDEILKSDELQKMYLEAIPFNVRYRLANECTMTSNVSIKYDGERFYWDIDITNRSDSVVPTGDLIDNFMTDNFDLSGNEQRIFAWDGQEYVIYSASADYATVDTEDLFPRTVGGPLTAGFIAWGQGNLTDADLKAAEVSAAQTDRDGTTQIRLSIEQTDGTLQEFFLDPAKDYAVTGCTVQQSDNTVTTVYYDGYEQVAESWVPSSMLIEKHEVLTGRLLRSDKWEINSVEARVPKADEFKIAYHNNTLIEYHSSVSDKTSLYRYASTVDTDAMLAEHLTYEAQKGKQKQNCATVALKHAAAQLGKSISDEKLAPLVDSKGRTSMYDLKQYAEGLGLHCRAVKADPSTLKDLLDCQIILHLPNKDHFVVLDRLDDKEAWIVDLSRENFYYRKPVASTPTLWSRGTAMLLSKQPLAECSGVAAEASLRQMVGATYYSCTDLIQSERVIMCNMACTSSFYYFWDRYGCEEADEGTCQWQTLARYITTGCVLDMLNNCLASEWYYGYMQACLTD